MESTRSPNYDSVYAQIYNDVSLDNKQMVMIKYSVCFFILAVIAFLLLENMKPKIKMLKNTKTVIIMIYSIVISLIILAGMSLTKSLF